jgi:hypothetical protein
MKIAWRVLLELVYLAVVIGILSVAESKFETLVLAGLVELYSAVLYNFSLLGENADVNNLAALVRFRILAAAHGVAGNEEIGPFIDLEKTVAETQRSYRSKILIQRYGNWAVSIYALFKIVQAIL